MTSCRPSRWLPRMGWTGTLLVTASCQWVFGGYELEHSADSDAGGGEPGSSGMSPGPGGETAAGGQGSPEGGSPATGATVGTGGEDEPPAEIGGTAGSAEPSTGGQEASDGGGTGGDSSTAGRASTGGSSTGGVQAASTGGVESTGGSSTAGVESTGGSSTAGVESTGGSAGTGGDPSTGGMSGSAGSEEPACSGDLYAGICWYLGELGATCTETCAARGGTADEASSYVGTVLQGGTLAECAALLAVLGVANTNQTARATSDYGVGCVVYFGDIASGEPLWVTDTAFDPDATLTSVQIACGCNQ